MLYLVDRRKAWAEVLVGSLNWLMSLSLSEADVLPSKPAVITCLVSDSYIHKS